MTPERPLFRIAALAAFVLLAGALSAGAADEANTTKGHSAAGAPLALHGHDPVAYFREGAPRFGRAEHAAVHEGATYYFASEESREAFEADPERYVPAFGGFCAYGVSVGKKFDGDPRYWTLHEGRLYLNLNEEIARTFAEDVPGNVRKAEEQWQRIAHRAAEDL